MKNLDKSTLKWRVHTPNLLKEILNNKGTWALAIPLQIFGEILFELGEVSSRLNDDKLNEIMMRLTIYSEADPESPNFNDKLVSKYLNTNL